MKFKSFHHLTLSTGHSRQSASTEVDDDVIALLAPTIAAGSGECGPDTGWFIEMHRLHTPGSCGFTLLFGNTRAVACHMAWKKEADEETWSFLQRVWKTPEVLKPRSIPWLTVTLLPMFSVLPIQAQFEAGDLERCVGWTILSNPDAIGYSPAFR